MKPEKWSGAANEAVAALIADGEARRARQLQDLLDYAERSYGQGMAEALDALRRTEESLAALRGQQEYRRARGEAR